MKRQLVAAPAKPPADDDDGEAVRHKRHKLVIDSDDEEQSSSFRTPVKPTRMLIAMPSTVGSSRSETPSRSSETRYAWLDKPLDANKRPPDHPEYDATTLFIPQSAWLSFTPFEQQYWTIKQHHWQTVVFFKKGKFYELFEHDADIGHQQFDLKLTQRVNMRMVGVPESSFDYWASQFLAKGFRVARVEQLENSVAKAMRDRQSNKTPSIKASSIIRRELTQVLTPGTLVDAGMLTSDMGVYCMAIKESNLSFGIAFVDAASASFQLAEFMDDDCRTRLETLLLQMKPVELVVEKSISRSTLQLIKRILPSNLQFHHLPAFTDAEATVADCERHNYLPEMLRQTASEKPLAVSAMGALVNYLRTLKLDESLVSAGNIGIYDPVQISSLVLDGQTLSNLEVLHNSSDGSSKGTLLQLLNHCATPMGKRLFKQWLCHPLRSIDALNGRLDAIDDLSSCQGVLDDLKTSLSKLPDLERCVARIHSGNCLVKDFVACLGGFLEVQRIIEATVHPISDGFHSKTLQSLISRFEALQPGIVETCESFIESFDVRVASTENKLHPCSGLDECYDACQTDLDGVELQLDTYRKECERTLGKRVTFKDIGKEIYQLEVSNSVKTPSDWVVMSKTKEVNRFYTADLRELVRQYLEARERREAALKNVKANVYKRFDEHSQMWRNVCGIVAELDCLANLATCRLTMAEPVCRPEFITGNTSCFEAKDLRHPCVVPSGGQEFIANDTTLGDGDRMVLLTGPNMGGKSTLLRQICIAVIMAQLGCYVPASALKMGLFDRIFTRIGANDNIMAGQSTFMVELSQTSKIIREASRNSLVILDELGRGTSTHDGHAIAYAVLYHLVTHVGCLGLFSTHYAALSTEFACHPGVALKHMGFQIGSETNSVTFLYKLLDGGCPKSYGMNVATIAGVPAQVVSTAESVANGFEELQKGKREAVKENMDLNLLDLSLFKHMITWTDLIK